MKNPLRLAVAGLLLAGCASDTDTTSDEYSADSLRAAVAVEISQAAAKQKVEERAERQRREKENAALAERRCSAASLLPGSLRVVMEEPRNYVGADSCAQQLLDGIVTRFVRTNEKQYLEALDALSRVSDSKSTEVMGNAVLDLFRTRPVELVRHLYDLQGDPSATEVDALLVTEIQLGRNSTFDNEIRQILERLETGAELTTDQKRFLARIDELLQKPEEL